MNVDLETIRARADAATEGPWFFNVNDTIGGWLVGNRDKPASQYDNRSESVTGDREVADFLDGNDAEFIAAARTDIPALLDLVEEARGLLAAWLEDFDDYRGTFSTSASTRAFLARLEAKETP